MSTDAPAVLTPEEQLQGAGLPELTIGGGTPAEVAAAPAPVILRGKLDKDGTGIGTGRRKTSTARVRVRDGSGKITINGREFEEFTRVVRDRLKIQEVLRKAEAEGKVDVTANVDGGGITGQTGAIILGLARALEARNPGLHHLFKEHGFLTRDDRMVERKKYGRRKARRSFQFSKR